MAETISDEKLARMAEATNGTTGQMARELLELRHFRQTSLNPSRCDPMPQPRITDGLIACVACGESDLYVVGEMEEWRDVDPRLTVWDEPAVVHFGPAEGGHDVSYWAQMTATWEIGNGTDSEGEYLRCRGCMTEMAMPEGVEVDWQ